MSATPIASSKIISYLDGELIICAKNPLHLQVEELLYLMLVSVFVKSKRGSSNCRFFSSSRTSFTFSNFSASSCCLLFEMEFQLNVLAFVSFSKNIKKNSHIQELHYL